MYMWYDDYNQYYNMLQNECFNITSWLMFAKMEHCNGVKFMLNIVWSFQDVESTFPFVQ